MQNFSIIEYEGINNIKGKIALLGKSSPVWLTTFPNKYAIDGSFNYDSNVYGSGVVKVSDDGANLACFFSTGCNPDFAIRRNVAGEVLAFVLALRQANANGYREVTIIHDYYVLYQFVSGQCKFHVGSLREFLVDEIEHAQLLGLERLNFICINSHSSIKCNNLADRLAKYAVGLKDVPPVSNLIRLAVE